MGACGTKLQKGRDSVNDGSLIRGKQKVHQQNISFASGQQETEKLIDKDDIFDTLELTQDDNLRPRHESSADDVELKDHDSVNDGSLISGKQKAHQQNISIASPQQETDIFDMLAFELAQDDNLRPRHESSADDVELKDHDSVNDGSLISGKQKAHQQNISIASPQQETDIFDMLAFELAQDDNLRPHNESSTDDVAALKDHDPVNDGSVISGKHKVSQQNTSIVSPQQETAEVIDKDDTFEIHNLHPHNESSQEDADELKEISKKLTLDHLILANQSQVCGETVQYCLCCVRIVHIMQYYQSLNVHNQSDQQNMIILCNDVYTALLNDYIHMIQNHKEQHKDIFNMLQATCAIDKCSRIIRHYRFENQQIEEPDDKFEFYRDVLDSMHCYLYHLQDVVFQKPTDATINSILMATRAVLPKLEGFNTYFHRYQQNRFRLFYSFQLEDDDNSVFIDGLYRCMEAAGFKHQMFLLQQRIQTDEYDTDALKHDINSIDSTDNANSNIMQFVTHKYAYQCIADYIYETKRLFVFTRS
eukprot:232158_1